MPVTLKTGVMKYRNPDGSYSIMDALLQEPTNDQIVAIESAGQEQIDAVEQKGEEILADLPQEYTELETEVSELKSEIDNIENLRADEIISNTYTGTQSLSITQALPAGTYQITAENVVSSDTDSTKCLFLFMNGNTQIDASQCLFERGKSNTFIFTTTVAATRFIMFASNNYANGANDSFTFTGFKIENVSLLLAKINGTAAESQATSETVVNIKSTVYDFATTYLQGTYSGTRSISVTKTFPIGDYMIQLDKVESTDKDDAISVIMFSTSDNQEIVSVPMYRNKAQTVFVHLPQIAYKVFFYAGDRYILSANDTFTYTNVRIMAVNSKMLYGKPVPTPEGFTWTDHPLKGRIFRTESRITCDFDVSDLKLTPNKTYWVSPNGDDSSTGEDSEHPLQSIRTAMLKSDVDSIVLMDGFYPVDLAPQHVNGLARSVSIVADSGANPVISSNSGAHTWAKTSGKTNVYEIAEDSNAVWDIDNSIPYIRLNSIDDVDDTAASFYSDGTNTYVHTSDGNAASQWIRCCTSTDNFYITTSGIIKVYLEGLTIVGGSAGAFRAVCDGTNRSKVYAKNCKFIGAETWGACYLEGVESIMQNCEAFYSKSDGFGIHRNNETGTVAPYAIEINCHGHNNGIAGNTTSNGTTSHSAAKVIRINGKYHDNVGPNVADVQNGTVAWNLDCHAWKSLRGEEVPGNSDFLPSDGSVKMWLDNCSGYGSFYGLYVNDGATAYVRGGIYDKVGVHNYGHMESY